MPEWAWWIIGPIIWVVVGIATRPVLARTMFRNSGAAGFGTDNSDDPADLTLAVLASPLFAALCCAVLVPYSVGWVIWHWQHRNT